MATVINEIDQQKRVYDKDQLGTTADLMIDNSQTPKEVEENFDQFRDVAIRTLSRRKKNYHWKTRNKSFINLFNDFYKMGIKNNKFFLLLYDKDLEVIDPYDPHLPLDLQLKIMLECMINPWYWLREICRIPADGTPVEVGGGVQYQIDRNNAVCWYLFLNAIDHYQSKPRQRGKTHDCLAKVNYAYHFGSISSSFLFISKDGDLAAKNLYRFKCHRDMLPAWMQMRNVILENGKVDRGVENIKSIRNPVTNNTISVMGKATSLEVARKMGRGETASISHMDEVDFTPYATEIMKAAGPAYSRAAENAEKHGMLHCRLLSSTPGDLDTKSGQEATELIGKMLHWEDRMLDMPIDQLQKEIRSPRYNGFVFVEHNWKQLKLPISWYEEMCRDVQFDQMQILREIELQRLHGSDLSPFDRNDIMYLVAHKESPIEKVDIAKNLCTFNIYEKLRINYPYILSVDPAEGLSRDNTAVTIINPYTLKPAVEFRSPYLSQTEFGRMLIDFMDQYCPKCMIVIEANRGRELLNFLLDSKYRYQIYYDESRIDSRPTETKNLFGALKKKANQRRAFGFVTTPQNRREMYGILETLVEESKELIISEYLVEDIGGLIRKPNGKIEAGEGMHDDNVMSYLIGMYIYYNAPAALLEEFGIRRGARPPEELLMEDGKLTPEATIAKMKELTPQLPDELRALFEDVLQEKNPVDESFKYQREIQTMSRQFQALTPPSDLSARERLERQGEIGITASPMDDSFWDAYDKECADSNFGRNYDVNPEDWGI